MSFIIISDNYTAIYKLIYKGERSSLGAANNTSNKDH